jgi:hypothetical protein
MEALKSDASRRGLIRLSLNLVPFAGIAFLWLIGVVRESLGDVEDRLFSTVFLGSGLLFLALLFVGTADSASLLEMLDGASADADVYAYGCDSAQTLLSVYGMRMAAVFTLSVSTVGLRTGAIPRWSPTRATPRRWSSCWWPENTGGRNWSSQVGCFW